METMVSEDYLTIEDLAERLGTSTHALYTQRHRDQPPGALGVKLGRRIFWRWSDIDAYFTKELAKQNGSTT